MILTNAKGEPYATPERPAAGAPIDDVIAYLSACHERSNRIAADANKAFAYGFAAALTSPRKVRRAPR